MVTQKQQESNHQDNKSHYLPHYLYNNNIMTRRYRGDEEQSFALGVAFFPVLVLFLLLQMCTSKKRAQEIRDNAAPRETVIVVQNGSSGSNTINNDQEQPSSSQPTATATAPVAVTKDTLPHFFHQRTIHRAESVRSIENVLQIIEEDDNPDDNDIEANTINNLTLVDGISSIRTTGERECCICLEVYKAGETIVWAKTGRCNHIFHESCACEWLQNHESCPLCRVDLIKVV